MRVAARTRTPCLHPSPSLHAHTGAHAHPPVLIWNIVGGAGPVGGSEIAPGATPPFERPKFPFLRSAAWGWKCRAASLQSPRGTATATLTALHRHRGLARLTRWPSAHIALAHRALRHTKNLAGIAPSLRKHGRADARYREDARARTQVGRARPSASVSACVSAFGPECEGRRLVFAPALDFKCL